MKRAYKYRFYPTPRQADQLNRTFGCVRKVYNLALGNTHPCMGGRPAAQHLRAVLGVG
ncbi:helix-turn-helix domain-containing protein [Micromonospora sp. NIE79]|uniref:Helix-turn-helix domain-containing protein n=1 Tax=Micromonospora trifolii TaxID=2911208 RepID=A0ABS9MUX9_9ACTN|nr:helix-turn-helix domain-containing protein [Micromonospora trifolii]MCG5441465.1 helix-turn-helix domain-containing protein [Micromonospora trifolii]